MLLCFANFKCNHLIFKHTWFRIEVGVGLKHWQVYDSHHTVQETQCISSYLSFFPWFHLLTYLITYVVGFEFDSWVHLITYLSFPFRLWKSVCIVIVAPLPFNYSQLPRKIWLTHSYYTLSSSTKNFFFMWVSSTKNTHELHTCRL